MKKDMGASPLATGPSQAEPKVSALRASVPSALSLDSSISLLKRVTEHDVRRDGPTESVLVRSGLLLDILNVFEAIERALRIRIWNECKAKGIPDAVAYRQINEEVSAAYMSGIAARSDETPAAAQPEGQEPDPQGDAQTTGEHPHG